jgi:methyl-accepting chemotaxis protein
MMLSGGTITAILLGILLSFLLVRRINRTINPVIGGLGQGAAHLASAASEISNTSQELAAGSSEQAAEVEETSSTLEEITAMTSQNVKSAEHAETLVKKTNQIVTETSSAMSDIVTSMDDISIASEETSKIIKTIDNIAFQTNLLALNAAVEAARAGEAGAGFAVVADEVRNLSMSAAEAARNTATLIETTINKVKNGTSLVQTASAKFDDVQQNANKVAELVGEITAASKEQARGVDQVNQSVAQVNNVTQQNAANAEESASASEELNALAVEMQGFVDELIKLVRKSGNNHEGNKTVPLGIEAGTDPGNADFIDEHTEDNHTEKIEPLFLQEQKKEVENL